MELMIAAAFLAGSLAGMALQKWLVPYFLARKGYKADLEARAREDERVERNKLVERHRGQLNAWAQTHTAIATGRIFSTPPLLPERLAHLLGERVVSQYTEALQSHMTTIIELMQDYSQDYHVTDEPLACQNHYNDQIGKVRRELHMALRDLVTFKDVGGA